jgi:hypothetical protein
MREWEEVNKNKIITVNGSNNEKYYVNQDSFNAYSRPREVKNYHTINDEKVGSEFISGYYENGQLKYRSQYTGEKKQGLWEKMVCQWTA